MKTSKTIAFFGILLLFISCNPAEEASENQQSTTYETIEKGASLDDARASLSEEFTEHNVGDNPEMVVMKFDNGNQLVFTDGQLTDKNSADELDEVFGEKEVE